MAFTVEDSFKEFIKNISISCDYSNMIEKRSNLVINLLGSKIKIKVIIMTLKYISTLLFTTTLKILIQMIQLLLSVLVILH